MVAILSAISPLFVLPAKFLVTNRRQTPVLQPPGRRILVAVAADIALARCAHRSETMSSYAKVGGGKLRLKGVGPVGSVSKPAGALASMGTTLGSKRPRDEQTSSSSSSSAHAASAAGAPANFPSSTEDAEQTAEPVREAGKGKLQASGTTLHGRDTSFQSQLSPGDAIAVVDEKSGKEEIRVVKFVLSDKSAAINAPFTNDLSVATAFHVLKLPKQRIDPAVAAANAEAQSRKAEQDAFGEFSSHGGTQYTYRVRQAGVHGGYKTITEKLDKPVSREELLDKRAKLKGDKFC